MSWIVTVMRIPEGINSTGDVPDSFKYIPLGSYDEVVNSLREIFPGADFSNPSWVVIHNSDYVSALMVRPEVPLVAFGLRSPSYEFIQVLYDRFGWRSIDSGSGAILPPFQD